MCCSAVVFSCRAARTHIPASAQLERIPLDGAWCLGVDTACRLHLSPAGQVSHCAETHDCGLWVRGRALQNWGSEEPLAQDGTPCPHPVP